MTTAADNTPLIHQLGDLNDYPVIASDCLYEGSAIGENGAGYARPLMGGDRFLGFCTERADNTTGAAGDILVHVRRRGVVQLAVTGLVITDGGMSVFAQDDATFSFSPVSGTYIGRVARYVSAGVGMVSFDADHTRSPWDGLTAEAITVDKTLAATDQGKLFWVTADAKIVTLPAVAGLSFAIVNGGADGTIAVNISPNASDGIGGVGLTNTDNKDLINTKATARRGDYVMVEYGDATGWIVSRSRGTWAKEA